METITIAYLIGSIISLILFFKVWGMTNDVKELKKQLTLKSDRFRVRHAIASKDPNLSGILFEEMFAALHTAYFYNGDILSVINEYKRYYKHAEIEFPQEFDNMSRDKFAEYL